MKPLRALNTFLLFGLASTSLLAQDDRAATDATVSAIRDGGTTLTSWLMERAGGEPVFADTDSQRTKFDWRACPSITFTEARRLLGADLGGKLSERDGWGHAIEYCLRTTEGGKARHTVGVRSPGRDGSFEATTYTAGGFDPAQPDHDIVGIDGIFVTWPRHHR